MDMEADVPVGEGLTRCIREGVAGTAMLIASKRRLVEFIYMRTTDGTEREHVLVLCLQFTHPSVRIVQIALIFVVELFW